jgi:ATP-dependent helicase HrpA
MRKDTEFSGNWNYPSELPVVEHRQEILDALEAHQVVVVVSDTGSGKTTQLPKMVAEAMGPDGGRIGCTQPRRIAAASVARRVAEELAVPLGGFVGYQVRFEDKTSRDTRIKFMTDGILLAETQGDPELRQYEVLILDEAHERSLNIDFLLGYLKRLLAKRPALKLVISSATLDAGSFAAFFATDGGNPVPVIEAPGRMFPVAEFFLPPKDDEDLPQHVARAVEWLGGVEPRGDVLVFLPGEREIRECADVLEGRRFPGTEVLPLFARLGLADQQRVFNPGNLRRLILATNVAETSLTIPRIACVIDSGVARVNRWAPGKGVQRLQIEPVSQASARQRKGRCGRVRDGVCVRLYEETELAERPEFTDPEIRRSSLAGVILRMKSLGLPEIDEFPFLDPPSPKAISEGYRTLREVGALDRDRNLTDHGRRMARLPVDPRLGRMLIEAQTEHCLPEMLPVIAALESNDPRERPAEKTREADAAHARWKDAESDFIGILRLWRDVSKFRDARGQWKRNALRKFCATAYLNARRVIEWANVADELAELLEREWKVKCAAMAAGETFPYVPIHRCLLAGVPRQFGLWDRENKAYRSASGGFFAVFPGSGLFGISNRHEWVVAMELVETSRLWARRVARIDPEWVEQVAPHLCRSRYGEAHWDEKQGAVYGKETVICGGLPVVAGRRVHYGRVDPKAAHAVFLREGLLGGGIRKRCRFLDHISQMRGEIEAIEEKLRRPGGLWSDEAMLRFFEERIPDSIHTAAAFHKWLADHEDTLMLSLADVLDEDLADLGLDGFPDSLHHDGQEYTLYYHAKQGERDDGVTLGVHVDQLPKLPAWLPAWGVDGNLRERAEILLRSLPKDYRRACQPIGAAADGFAELWSHAPKDATIQRALAESIRDRSGAVIPPDEFDFSKLPPHLVTKIWVCDDDGNELAMGEDVAVLKLQLADRMRERFEAVANADVERSGLSAWDGEALPERVETPGGAAFPALVDEGSSVGVRAFTSAAEATESHRAGGARLLCLTHPDQVNHLRKKFPLGLMAKVELPRLGTGGTSLEDLILLAAEGAAGGCFPHSPDDFRRLAAESRGHWFEAASAIAKSLDESLEILPAIRDWIATHRKDRNLGEIAEDLDEQLAWLFRQRFAWRAGFSGLCDYPRRLRAIRSRLGRISSLPIVKDLEKMERVRRHWQPWFRRWTADPDDPALWQFGWALEEFRVSLFAPDVPCLTKVSEKRLEEMLATPR